MKALLTYTAFWMMSAMVVASGFASEIDGDVSWGSWSDPIQESGKNSGGTSVYTCAVGQVMVGRRHKGDENGYTWYLCATVSYAGTNAEVGEGRWSAWIQESGKDSGGTSSYECPINSVMIGRRHKGDEHGDTSYECAPLTLSAHGLAFRPLGWSEWIEESGENSGGTSDFTCPADQLMIGRKHSGDENGDTSYLCAAIEWSASPIGASAPFQSYPIEESGKNSGGTSSFTCPSGYLMTHRSHKGDENGDTRYSCRTPQSDSAGPIAVIPTAWSEWIQESGKNSRGRSGFTCPSAEAMIAREHSGDEDGDTRYRCALASSQGEFMQFTPTEWSAWEKESKSSFSCPDDQFMIGREHKGDENGKTRYRCAYGRFPFHLSTLATVLDHINSKVGDPATTDSSEFAARDDMRVDDDYFLHFDIGGEGFHESGGVASGFVGAMNINAQTTDSQPPFEPIPLLIHVESWDRDPPYPIADKTADYLTIQGAPLTDKNVEEMGRVLGANGNIGLWVCPGDTVPGSTKTVGENLDALASSLSSKWTYSCASSWSRACMNDRDAKCDSGCLDEFNGAFGSPKICIKNSRQ